MVDQKSIIKLTLCILMGSAISPSCTSNWFACAFASEPTISAKELKSIPYYNPSLTVDFTCIDFNHPYIAIKDSADYTIEFLCFYRNGLVKKETARFGSKPKSIRIFTGDLDKISCLGGIYGMADYAGETGKMVLLHPLINSKEVYIFNCDQTSITLSKDEKESLEKRIMSLNQYTLDKSITLEKVVHP